MVSVPTEKKQEGPQACGNSEILEQYKRVQATVAERSARLAEIRRTLEVYHDGAECFEIRVLGLPGRGKPHQASGYFNDFGKAAAETLQMEARKPVGIYTVVNAIPAALLGRAINRFVEYPPLTTRDEEVSHRRWLILDCDPKHLAGVAATDAESLAAKKLAGTVKKWLGSLGWPEPLVGMTGNGYALLYRIDLPNDDVAKTLVSAVLAAVNYKSGWLCQEPAHIDLTMFNASRIYRLFGTTNRKGEETADRPHRRSLLRDPGELPLEIVTVDQLRQVAAQAPRDNHKPTAGRTSPAVVRDQSRVLMDDYLADRRVTVKQKKQDNQGRDMWILEQCPVNSSHGSTNEVAFFQDPSTGKPGFQCKHNGCAGIDWRQVTEHIGRPEPHHYDPPLRTRVNANTPPRKPVDATRPAPITNTPVSPSDVTLPGRVLQVIDAKTFAANEYKLEYIVENVLVAGQPAICGGLSKTLKTSILCDLAISVATGTPFLGKFPAKRHTVAFLSGESGEAAIQNVARRVCKSKNVDLASASMFFGFELPSLGSDDDIAAMCDMILACNARLVIVDPIYLCLMTGSSGLQTANMFDMGPLLLRLTELGRQTDATILLCHHFRKNPADPRERYEPPDLQELAMSGFDQWARQCILIGRREKYVDESGLHRLWVKMHGSAGHEACVALDVNEGHNSDPNGRQWELTVSKQKEAREQISLEKEKKRTEEQQAALSRREAKAMQWLAQVEGVTKSDLSKKAGITKGAIDEVISSLARQEKIESVTQKICGVNREVFRLTEKYR
jgi:hypothetical protein